MNKIYLLLPDLYLSLTPCFFRASRCLGRDLGESLVAIFFGDLSHLTFQHSRFSLKGILTIALLCYQYLFYFRANEKQALSALEKKFAEEKKQRSDFQQKLEAERKNKKEANAERVAAVAQQSANRNVYIFAS